MIAQAYGLATKLYAVTVPDGAPNAPGALTSRANTFVGFVKWGGLLALVVGLIMAAASMPLSHNRGGSHVEAASKVGMVAVAAIIIGSVAAVVGFLVG